MEDLLLQENGDAILLDGYVDVYLATDPRSVQPVVGGGGSLRRRRRSQLEGGDNSTPIDDMPQRRKIARQNASIVVVLH